MLCVVCAAAALRAVRGVVVCIVVLFSGLNNDSGISAAVSVINVRKKRGDLLLDKKKAKMKKKRRELKVQLLVVGFHH